MALTPNLNMDLPVPSTTVGPTYASMNNTAFDLIDEHDHSSGKGVAVTPAGLNINANLAMGTYSLTNLGSADLTDQSAALTTGSARLFAYGGELYYRDAASNNVQMTNGGIVAGAAAGAISGLTSPASATYSAVTGRFTWLVDTGLVAKMAVSDVSVYAYGEVSPNAITIKSPASLASAYSFTLPAAVPAATYPVTMTAAGILGNSGTIGVANGSVSAPSIMFAGDTNTGLYLGDTDTIAWTTGGVLGMYLSPTKLVLNTDVNIEATEGTAAIPAYSFNADPNTGMYWAAADNIGWSTGGTLRMDLSTTALTINVPLYAGAGLEATPSHTFAADPDTGMFRAASNNIGFSTGGTNRLNITSAGLTVTGGVVTTGAIDIAGGGAFKVTIFQDTTSAASVTLDIGAGAIYGYSGRAYQGASSTNLELIADGAAAGTNFYFDTVGITGDKIKIVNDGAGNMTYFVSIIHT